MRGIRLAEGDTVISMSILRDVDSTAEERAGYLKQAAAARRGADDVVESAGGEDDEATNAAALSAERFAELAAQEEFILTASARGFGKRSSSYEYRITGRGGQGIMNMDMSERNGEVVAAFPVTVGQDVMLVTNGGQIIRMPVDDIRIADRRTQGVTLFRVAEGEQVVSVAALEDEGEADAAVTE